MGDIGHGVCKLLLFFFQSLSLFLQQNGDLIDLASQDAKLPLFIVLHCKAVLALANIPKVVCQLPQFPITVVGKQKKEEQQNKAKSPYRDASCGADKKKPPRPTPQR